MKNFQQNLLILLALGLCGLCVFQWRGQTLQRNEIGKLNQTVYEKSEAIQGYTNSIQTMDHQIAELQAQVMKLGAAARTNEQQIMTQLTEINKLRLTAEAMTNQVAEYKKGADLLETKLKEAYAGIEKQNQTLKELAAQRDEFVQKFNDSVKDRNEVVAKYNDLAAGVEKLQNGKK